MQLFRRLKPTNIIFTIYKTKTMDFPVEFKHLGCEISKKSLGIFHIPKKRGYKNENECSRVSYFNKLGKSLQNNRKIRQIVQVSCYYDMKTIIVLFVSAFDVFLYFLSCIILPLEASLHMLSFQILLFLRLCFPIEFFIHTREKQM